MTQLNFFIKPLSAELQVRTLVAHVARGFCWMVSSPPKAPIRSSLQLRMSLGLMRHLPSYKFGADCVQLKSGLANQILQLAAAHWQRELGEFNTHWIDLEFKQLMSFNQIDAIVLATSFLNRGQYVTDKAERMHTMQISDKIPSDVLHRLNDSLASLESALVAKDPMMPNHLRNTHALLISYPETVHLLDDAEIARIIDAAEMHTKTEIVKAVASGRSAGTKKKVDVGDL
jgi:hypothetical protein